MSDVLKPKCLIKLFKNKRLRGGVGMYKHVFIYIGANPAHSKTVHSLLYISSVYIVRI